jgi:cation:H+ antiporter
MPELFFWIGVFVLSLIVLLRASDYFTGSAEKIGLFFGLPPFIVGVTIVALGTSLPELVSSIFAVFSGSSEIVVGNVVGSNIANIFLILGVAAILGKKIKMTYALINVDLPVLAGSAFLFAIMIWDGAFTLPEAIISIAGMIIYLSYTTSVQKAKKDVEIKKEMKGELRKKRPDAKVWLILILSTFFIYLGAKFTVDSIINLSQILNIGKELIAVSAVALGTSLPELAVTLSAARNGKPEIVVGNILGSNIFNTFAVMGIPGLFGALLIPATILTFSLPIMIIATLLFFFMTQEKIVSNWEGYILILFYIVFIGKLFGLF